MKSIVPILTLLWSLFVGSQSLTAQTSSSTEKIEQLRSIVGAQQKALQVLQARHIPSKLLYFEEENHWVLKPADSILWYHTVLGWLDQWVKPDRTEYQKQLEAASAEPGAAKLE